jgi:hypothetical protein
MQIKLYFFVVLKLHGVDRQPLDFFYTLYKYKFCFGVQKKDCLRNKSIFFLFCNYD